MNVTPSELCICQWNPLSLIIWLLMVVEIMEKYWNVLCNYFTEILIWFHITLHACKLKLIFFKYKNMTSTLSLFYKPQNGRTIHSSDSETKLNQASRCWSPASWMCERRNRASNYFFIRIARCHWMWRMNKCLSTTSICSDCYSLFM